MNRKEFLKYLSLTPLLTESLFDLLKKPKMIERAILSSSEKLPVIGLGTWRQFDVGSDNDERNSLIDVLNLLNENGGKVIDSSPMYNRSEGVVGDLLKSKPYKDSFFYATKVWTSGLNSGIDQMNQSFKLMNRTTMDLMQIHNLLDWKIHIKTLKDWKSEGKIRYIGITHYTDSAHADLENVIKSESEIDFVQVNYNILNRNAESSLLKTAKDHNVSVIINRPYEGGDLFRRVKGKPLPSFVEPYDIKSWGQYFLKYIISNPAVTCVIPGTSSPKHMTDNLQAGFGNLPNEKDRIKMIDYLK